jgi:DNA-binding IclR family transcriptional regulator
VIDQGKVAAAISVAGPVTRIGRDKIPFLAKAVMTSAKAIAARLDASEFMEMEFAGGAQH